MGNQLHVEFLVIAIGLIFGGLGLESDADELAEAAALVLTVLGAVLLGKGQKLALQPAQEDEDQLLLLY
jgi:hypothetical protein